MSEYVTHDELAEALVAVRQDIDATEQRLREEWTSTVRYETGRISDHLGEQDAKLDKVYYLILTLLLTLIGALVYSALH